ncbi:MAG TPA: maleylpyruvate isomerase family mycothiol-dependent enzyme [Acidimicrobiales bacterium]
MADATWDFRDPASRERLLGVLHREEDEMFGLVSDPDRWEAPTACEGWQVRDVVGHLVDTTEGYLSAFELARSGGTPPEPLGLQVMAETVDKGAKAFRKVPQGEMVERLRADAGQMMDIFASLPDGDWQGFMPPHKYMGPAPAMFFAIFQLVDYAVHGWDIRQGIGRPHAIAGDTADLLVPLMFLLLPATADTSGVTEPFSVGIRTTGVNGGDVRADVSSEGVQIAPGSVDDCAAVIEVDPASFVLTGYGRINGGTVRGDREAASRFRQLFFAI